MQTVIYVQSLAVWMKELVTTIQLRRHRVLVTTLLVWSQVVQIQMRVITTTQRM